MDVAIVGAGYTGLWTAYYLALVDPSLRIAVVEKEVAGFGASGRNGGWCSALFDWFSSVGFDRSTGSAWAGGYVGDGVATSNLAGRTLADLICGRDTDLVRLPWVGHRSPGWEPEPLRWLGANAGLRVMSLADAVEDRTGRASRPAAAVSRLLGAEA